jgi:serine/threonine-protein kinase
VNLPAGAPRRFGRWRVLRPLGEGAMGTVWLAVDDAGGQAAAIKRFAQDPDLQGAAFDEARERFLAEAALGRRLDHPDIVRILDAGAATDALWLAMEAVPGGSLARYTRAPRLLPEPLVLRLGARVAGALAHAHAAGVVHRDVKPSNVLVHWPTDTVKLADFGVARLADAAQTRTGLVMGSPAYMAPEQLAGAPASPAADLYALGVMLFELLTGRLPFDADSLGELLRQVADVPAPDLAALRPALPADAASLIGALLAKSPAARPAGAAQVAAALRASAG